MSQAALTDQRVEFYKTLLSKAEQLERTFQAEKEAIKAKLNGRSEKHEGYCLREARRRILAERQQHQSTSASTAAKESKGKLLCISREAVRALTAK